MKIAHISDLHIDPMSNGRYLSRIVSKINDNNPDLVFITGDLVDGFFEQESFTALDDIKAEVYAVMGNHEIRITSYNVCYTKLLRI